MTDPLPILLLTDGKPGHENQSLGLIGAIDRLTPVGVERMRISKRRLAALLQVPSPERQPALIIGAGHRTHLPMLALSRRSHAPCVLLMKPTIPAAFFDLCIIPEHDLGRSDAGPHTIVSKGALNRVPPLADTTKHGGLILIGGASKAHDWNEAKVVEAVTAIIERGRDRPWRITDSRRTPDGTLDRISKACPEVAAYPHTSTGAEWLPQRLSEAAEVWVTSDSISMIYESLSSGAHVGLIPMPRKKPGRVARGVDQLIEDGWITPFEAWLRSNELPAPPRILREADRCATLVLERYLPDRLP